MGSYIFLVFCRILLMKSYKNFTSFGFILFSFFHVFCTFPCKVNISCDPSKHGKAIYLHTFWASNFEFSIGRNGRFSQGPRKLDTVLDSEIQGRNGL